MCGKQKPQGEEHTSSVYLNYKNDEEYCSCGVTHEEHVGNRKVQESSDHTSDERGQTETEHALNIAVQRNDEGESPT